MTIVVANVLKLKAGHRSSALRRLQGTFRVYFEKSISW